MGQVETDASEAVDAFMRREFTDILDHDQVEHPVFFVPPNFIFNKLTEQVSQC